MLNLIKNAIKKFIETIPGVVGLSVIEDGINDSIIINKFEDDSLDIKIALEIDKNTFLYNMSKQIKEAIKFILEKNNFIDFKLHIYIKGVK